ncbi:9564_t:CDS:2, partial [Scutellospora calospora]
KYNTIAMPLPLILDKYIVKTSEKLNKNNTKKCPNFATETTPEERKNVFKLINTPTEETTETTSLSSRSSASKIIRSSFSGPMDDYIVRALSPEDTKKFHQLLLQLTVSCGWALHWVNKPEAAELFEFLNPLLKLPDRRLKDEQYAKYKKYYTINDPGETQWNSFYNICSSLIRSQKALQILAIKFEPPIRETLRARAEPKLKPLQMSKLRADIMYNHRLQSQNQIYAYDDIPEQQPNIIEMDSVEQTNPNIEMSTLISRDNSFSEDVELNISSENILSENIFSENISSENIELEESSDDELDELTSTQGRENTN